ncbi:hypothetical protein [Faecalispora jeddahensis]|uniref:hypothetical protein n=1 Tax=Faecalispora jeddahensis TaxID=1414721 RepID=UPI001897C0B7|nr:hypothetical protein [Faecalispora jeddahensis]
MRRKRRFMIYAPGVYESWLAECKEADREDNAKSGNQSRLKQLRERKKKAAKLCKA